MLPLSVPQLRGIITQVNNILGLPSADNLLLGTAAQESHLGEYRLQMSGGPGRGIYQIEGATHNDIWDNWLKYRPDITNKVMQIAKLSPLGLNTTMNDYYATAIARIKYFRASEKLPDMNDIPALARYWKKYYNTPAGGGLESQFINNYCNYILSK